MKSVFVSAKGPKFSCKLLLRTVARDCNSITGKNLRNLEMESQHCVSLDSIKHNISKICNNIHFEEIPDSQKWRLTLIKELSLVKSGHLILDEFDEELLQQLVKFVCCS